MAENAFTLHIRQQLVQLEITMIDGLSAECDRGQMTPEQFEWALNFFTSLDQYDGAEAAAQLAAWTTWRDQTHPGWDATRAGGVTDGKAA